MNITSHAISLSVLFSKFVNSADSIGYNGMSNIFVPNVEIRIFGWYFWKIFDKIKNMIELIFIIIMETLLLKDLQSDFPTNHELFWDVKMKNRFLEKKIENLEKKLARLFQ